MSGELATIFRCPACGQKVTGLENSCPNCALPFDDTVKFECPFCSSKVSPAASTCPSCKVVFREVPKAADDSHVATAMGEILKDIEALEKDSASAEIRALEEMLAKAKQTINGTAPPESAVCSVCNSAIPQGSTRCPLCSAQLASKDNLAAEKALEEIKILAEKQSVVPPPPSPPEHMTGLRAKAEIARTREGDSGTHDEGFGKRQRKLRGLSNGIGATNGIGTRPPGRINGMHFVNGKGAVNGRSMVNGTGILNGLKPKGPMTRMRFGSISKLLSWQFLVVLVAIIIVVPTMLFIQGNGSNNPFAVDGDFDEWEDSTHFGILASSQSSSINVTEWSVGIHDSRLYLYLRTQSSTMTDSTPESFTLFIDSDSSKSTGYTVSDIGADLMLEVMGWNGSVGQSSLYVFSSSQDQQDWSRWQYSRGAEYEAVGAEMEIGVELPFAVQQSARLILTSQDNDGPGCASSSVVLDGSLLVVEQMPGPAISATGILPAGSQEALLGLRFSCQGAGGTVESIVPTLTGVGSYDSIEPFSLAMGDQRTVYVRVDTSMMSPGDFVSAQLTSENITSTFTKVQVLGAAANAYVGSPPSVISIDGAFADWDGLKVVDTDSVSVKNPSINIEEVGGVSSAQNSYFYVSVHGEMMSGTYVPKEFMIPSGSGGGGIVVPKRQTAEDFMNIYIDSDRSNATGYGHSLGGLVIGADYMIEIKGLHSKITSKSLYQYTGGQWTGLQSPVDAANDLRRIEIGLESSAIGGSIAVDFLVETTDWKGTQDLATNDSSGQGTKRWVVDSTSTSPWSTAMSYQRKSFYDGTNYWSFYYDGTNTVCEYSSDNGVTWTYRGTVFTNTGVKNASLWYDSSGNIVYVVGDTSTASTNVYLQRGNVTPASATISWAGADSTLATSANAMANKNTFICKDASGFVWVFSSNQSASQPVRYDLSAFRSASTDNISSWTYSGNMLTADSIGVSIKGTILPAGSGSDVWAIYSYEKKICSRKFAGGSWGAELGVFTGSKSGAYIDMAPPSAVVDANGVVHVVYGDGHEDTGRNPKPYIQYTYNSGSGWASDLRLDQASSENGNKYPTISLDSSSGNIFVFWVQMDNNSIVAKMNVSGTWSFVDLGSQTSYVKEYLTSVYSVSQQDLICFLWTQNTTGTIDVIFDVIPEFENTILPILSIMTAFIACCVWRKRRPA